MNDVIETILKRRSIRAYKEAQISDEELKTLLTCALYAPTGGNLQNSRFLVIQKRELLDELNEAIRENLASREPVPGEMMTKGILRARTPEYHFIFHAPTLISAVALETTPTAWRTAAADWKISRSLRRPWDLEAAGATSPTGSQGKR